MSEFRTIPFQEGEYRIIIGRTTVFAHYSNLVPSGVVAAVSNSGGIHIITTQTEHKAVLNTCNEMKENGVQVTFLPVNQEGDSKGHCETEPSILPELLDLQRPLREKSPAGLPAFSAEMLF